MTKVKFDIAGQVPSKKNNKRLLFTTATIDDMTSTI